MNKLDDETIRKIRAYPPEVTHSDVGRELGVCRQSVARYRKWVADALEPKEEKKEEKPDMSAALIEALSSLKNSLTTD